MTDKTGSKNKGQKLSDDIPSDQNGLDYNFKYNYSEFSQIKEQGEYNFYGIIYDATFPEQEPNNAILPGNNQPLPKYSCIIKLIDQNTNCLTCNNSNFNDNIITLIIKGNEKENLPYIHRIGDIIRVHRGLYSPKKKRSVYLNILKGNQFKGSWCIFSLEDQKNDPYSCSHQTFTFESQDIKYIQSFRKWGQTYLALKNSLIYNKQKNLSDRLNEGSDNDLLVQVVKKVELDDQIILYIQDETDGCQLHTYKYYDFIKEGDLIRVRNYKIFNKESLIINEYGNILKIPQNSNVYKTIIMALANKLKAIQTKK